MTKKDEAQTLAELAVKFLNREHPLRKLSEEYLRLKLCETATAVGSIAALDDLDAARSGT